jgi:beta-glucosidase
MPQMNSFKPWLLLAAGFLAAPACRLDPPTSGVAPDASSAACVDDEIDEYTGPAGTGFTGSVDGGQAGGVDSGAGVGITVTPVSCNGTNSAAALALFKYAPGYKADPAVRQRAEDTVNKSGITLEDEATQMRGVEFGTASAPQMHDIERSYDTATIRGYRYRDASRGVNFAEDFGGTKLNAGTVNGKQVGFSTAFPVSMARGAAFDLDLEYFIGKAIGDEMQAAEETLMLAPCMNLLRHPLWGRAQETYGEDSFHVGRLASAMAVGVQQHIAANAKHYMAYDIEINRSLNNSVLDEQTLREIYGRHFRMVVQDGGVASVMAAYNMVNGVKSTENRHLITEVLREDFGFQGFVLSDWWAMTHSYHVVDAAQLKDIAVQGVKAGLDVELPWSLNFSQLESIVRTNGGLTKADIDTAVKRILEQKFRFNADKLENTGLGSTHTNFENDQITCNDRHVRLARTAALESMVLLKNDSNTLPISRSVKKVAVLGKTLSFVTNNDTVNTEDKVNFATDVITGDMGSSRVYHHPSKGISPAAGIQKMAAKLDPAPTVVVGTTAAEAADADFVVVMAGLTPGDEGEEYTLAGDRVTFGLDAKQTDPQLIGLQDNLIRDVVKLGKPMVVVLIGGSVIDMPWKDIVPAVVMAWYPGQVGGEALAMLLWGEANFSGKLPFTWGSLRDYGTFNGNGDTIFDYYVGYRLFDKNSITPIFPFGYGLSYTTYEYRNLQLGCSDMSKGAILPVVVNVANTGTVAGDEIVMVFVSFPGTAARRSIKELKGFERVRLEPGEERQVTIPIRLSDLDYFKADSPTARTGKWVVESGDIQIMVGGSAASLPLSGTVKVNGY